MPTSSSTEQDSPVFAALPRISQRVSVRVRTVHAVSFAVAVVLAIVAVVTMRSLLGAQADVTQLNKRYKDCQDAVEQLLEASDYLTNESREYVKTGLRVHLDNYLEEVEQTDRRGNALSVLQDPAQKNDEAVAALEEARKISNQLSSTELYALRLVSDSLPEEDLPEALRDVNLAWADMDLSMADKKAKAQDLLYGNTYATRKLSIRNKVHICSEVLVDALHTDLRKGDERRQSLLITMMVTVISLVLVAGFIITMDWLLLLIPISHYEQSILSNLPLDEAGARELRLLTAAYNEMYKLNQARAETLQLEAHSDALTGALNRGAFDSLLTIHRKDSALMLVDVDHFKQFNDEYGHDMGDAILIEVVATLYSSFRSSDHICRIGGDEFAVIMTGVTPQVRDIIAHKIGKVQSFLADTSNGLPAATVSIGVAFGNPMCTDDGLFQQADRALYEVKRRGRNGFAFADEL